MEKLPRNISDFIVRDLSYIVGGGIVLASFLYRFDRLPDKDTPLAFYVLAAGLAYVVGNTLQDVFSILRLVSTAHVTKLWRPLKWCYERFTAEKWNDIESFDPSKVRQALRSKKDNNQAWAASYERSISGLILAATMTPCALISSVIIWSQWYMCQNEFDFWLAVTSLVLSVGLFALARIRAAQVTLNDAEIQKEYEQKMATNTGQSVR